MKYLILFCNHEVLCLGSRLARNNSHIVLQLLAEFTQRQIVDIVAKWGFNFAPDGGNPEDDIGANDGSRDGDPSERLPKLEWEGDYVDPGDLGDGNAVGNGKRGVEYPFGPARTSLRELREAMAMDW